MTTMRSRAALVALPGLLLLSCASGLKLRVLTAPRTSEIDLATFRDQKQLERYRAEGGKLEVSLAKSVESVGIHAVSFGHQELDATITPAEIAALPERDGWHQLELALVQEFEEITQLVVDYDPLRQEFVGRKRRVLAYIDEGEDSGVPVTRVYDGLKAGNGIRGMAISPDGRRLVFAEATPVPGSRVDATRPQDNHIVLLESCTLHSIQLLDENGRRVSSGKTSLRSASNTDVDPFFTPDGQHIRFSSNRRRADSADILQISSTGTTGGIEDIYIDTRDHTALRPTIGKNEVMVFALYPPNRGRAVEASAKIWKKGGTSEYQTELVEGIQPHVSPDGTQIAYVGRNGNLYKINIDGTSPTELTTGADKIVRDYVATLADPSSFEPELFLPYSFPSWSPDGKWILFSSLAGKDGKGNPNEDIYIMRADGSQVRQLTTNGSSDTHPLMDRDMNFIYFLSNRGGRWAICSIPVPEGIAPGN